MAPSEACPEVHMADKVSGFTGWENYTIEDVGLIVNRLLETSRKAKEAKTGRYPETQGKRPVSLYPHGAPGHETRGGVPQAGGTRLQRPLTT